MSFIDHKYHITIDDSTQSMGYCNGSDILANLVQCLLNGHFILFVQSTSSFI